MQSVSNGYVSAGECERENWRGGETWPGRNLEFFNSNNKREQKQAGIYSWISCFSAGSPSGAKITGWPAMDLGQCLAAKARPF